MMSNDQAQKVWYDCGILRFWSFDLRDKKVQSIACLGCKEPWIQQWSLRYHYLSNFIIYFREKLSFFSKTLVVIINRKYGSLTTEIVVNCGRQFWIALNRSESTPSILPSAQSYAILNSHIKTTSRNIFGGRHGRSIEKYSL